MAEAALQADEKAASRGERRLSRRNRGTGSQGGWQNAAVGLENVGVRLRYPFRKGDTHL